MITRQRHSQRGKRDIASLKNHKNKGRTANLLSTPPTNASRRVYRVNGYPPIRVSSRCIVEQRLLRSIGPQLTERHGPLAHAPPRSVPNLQLLHRCLSSIYSPVMRSAIFIFSSSFGDTKSRKHGHERIDFFFSYYAWLASHATVISHSPSAALKHSHPCPLSRPSPDHNYRRHYCRLVDRGGFSDPCAVFLVRPLLCFLFAFVIAASALLLLCRVPTQPSRLDCPSQS